MTDKTVAYRRKTAADRRRDLIDAGIRCLGRNGMVGFTIDEICKQAGVSRGLINHHFHGKQALLQAIYSDMTAHLVDAPRALPADRVLSSIIETNFDEASFDQANLRAWLAIWGQVPTDPELQRLHRQRYSKYRRRIEDALRGVSRREAAAFDAASVARQLIALIDGLWLEYCLHSQSFSLAAARDDCYRLLRGYGIELK